MRCLMTDCSRETQPDSNYCDLHRPEMVLAELKVDSGWAESGYGEGPIESCGSPTPVDPVMIQGDE